MALLDVMRTVVAPVVIPLFTDTPLKFKRTERTYDPRTSVTSEVVTEVDIKATPFLSWTEEELRDDTLRKTDAKVIVPALTVEQAGINLRPGTEASVYCTRAGIKYMVIPVKRVPSGDLDAILILGLRK